MQFDRTQVGLIDQSQITQLIRTADTRFSHRLGVKHQFQYAVAGLQHGGGAGLCGRTQLAVIDAI